MKPIENRKHHYVPQFLLRNFANEERESLYAFDKWKGEQFGIAIADAAAERGYNAFETNEDSGCAEDFFTQIEDLASPVIRGIVTDLKLPAVSPTQKTALVQLATAQMLRSKNNRAVFTHLGEMIRGIAEREGTPDFKAWVGPPNPASDKRALLKSLEKDLLHFGRYLATKDLILCATQKSSPFLIGDSPLIRTNTLNSAEFCGTTGLNSPGVEAYLPLSPTLALGFMCPTIRLTCKEAIRKLGRNASTTCFDYLLAIELHHNLDLDPHHVDYLNSHQVVAAERFLYSGVEDFRMVREMLASDATLRTGRRLTISHGIADQR